MQIGGMRKGWICLGSEVGGSIVDREASGLRYSSFLLFSSLLPFSRVFADRQKQEG